MSDTITMECNCCRIETDCINGLCEWCSGYNYQLKQRIAELEEKHRWIPVSEGPPKPGRDFEAYSNTEEFPHSVILTNQWPEGAIFTHYRYITLPKGE